MSIAIGADHCLSFFALVSIIILPVCSSVLSWASGLIGFRISVACLVFMCMGLRLIAFPHYFSSVFVLDVRAFSLPYVFFSREKVIGQYGQFFSTMFFYVFFCNLSAYRFFIWLVGFSLCFKGAFICTADTYSSEY